MKYKKIVLAGGNGYLGRVLAEYYSPLCKDVVILSRTKKAQDGNITTVLWDGKTEGAWKNSFDISILNLFPPA